MNKKMFSITFELELSQKPDWLDDFRKKYDHPYEYHITLKTKSYFDEKDLKEIKTKLSEISKVTNKIKINFEKLRIDLSTKGWCIMIDAEENRELMGFQKYISSEFAKYGEHVDENSAKYEKDFHPHITIARKMDKDTCDKAESELVNDTHCEGIIKDLVLAVVDEDLSENWSAEKNRTIFKLKNI